MPLVLVHYKNLYQENLPQIKGTYRGQVSIVLPGRMDMSGQTCHNIESDPNNESSFAEICNHAGITPFIFPFRAVSDLTKLTGVIAPQKAEELVRLAQSSCVIVPVKTHQEAQAEERAHRFGFSVDGEQYHLAVYSYYLPQGPEEIFTNIINGKRVQVELYGDLIPQAQPVSPHHNSTIPQSRVQPRKGGGASTHHLHSKGGNENTKKTTWYGTILGISCILAAGGAYLAKFEQLNTVQAVALVLAALLLPNLLYVAYEKGPEMCSQSGA